MKTLSLILLCAFSLNAFADESELRGSLVDSSRAFLDEKLTADELIRTARAERSRRPFNDEEKLYLEDLTARLPSGVRKDLCPTLREGLCEGTTVASSWADVPVVEAPRPSAPDAEKSWLGRNWGWLATGVAVGFAANSLRGKRIQFHGLR